MPYDDLQHGIRKVKQADHDTIDGASDGTTALLGTKVTLAKRRQGATANANAAVESGSNNLSFWTTLHSILASSQRLLGMP
jgi:hypothetical protein